MQRKHAHEESALPSSSSSSSSSSRAELDSSAITQKAIRRIPSPAIVIVVTTILLFVAYGRVSTNSPLDSGPLPLPLPNDPVLQAGIDFGNPALNIQTGMPPLLNTQYIHDAVAKQAEQSKQLTTPAAGKMKAKPKFSITFPTGTGKQKMARNPTILFIGDQWTQGCYDHSCTPSYSYVDRVLDNFRVTSQIYIDPVLLTDPIQCFLHGCERPLMSRIQQLLENADNKQTYDMVILWLGVIDLAVGTSATDTMKGLREVHSYLEAKLSPSVPIVYLNLFDFEMEGHEPKQLYLSKHHFNQQLAAFCRLEVHCDVIDVERLFPQFSLTVEAKTQVWHDAMHPSQMGYRMIGDIVYKHIVQWFQ